MDLVKLRYFVAVAEELHFGQAARRLYLSQPALSTAIRSLERSLGMALFERTSRRVELTPAGTALLPDARRLLVAEDQLRATAAGQREAAHDRAGSRALRVALFTNGLDALTRPVHQAFERAHPGAPLHVRGHVGFDDHLQAVAQRRADVFVVRPPYQPVPGVTVIPLLEEPAVAVLRADDPRADAPHLDPEALLDDAWPDIPAAPAVWTSYWGLDQYRNGEHHRVAGGPVVAAGEDLGGVERETGITTTALSRARRDLYHPLVAVPITGMTSTIALAVREDHDQDVADYITTTQDVVRELVGLIPGATLSPSPTDDLTQASQPSSPLKHAPSA